MLKAVINALASYEDKGTPFLVVWDDSPYTSSAFRGHINMSTLIYIPAGHMRFVPAHKQSDGATSDLSPARLPVNSSSLPMKRNARRLSTTSGSKRSWPPPLWPHVASYPRPSYFSLHDPPRGLQTNLGRLRVLCARSPRARLLPHRER